MIPGMERDSVLAETEEIEVLSSALYAALEADLSCARWPRNSRTVLQSAFEEIDWLIGLTKKGG